MDAKLKKIEEDVMMIDDHNNKLNKVSHGVCFLKVQRPVNWHVWDVNVWCLLGPMVDNVG